MTILALILSLTSMTVALLSPWSSSSPSEAYQVRHAEVDRVMPPLPVEIH